MTAAGAHLIMFTTGRGTPLGGPVPVVKVSTNSNLANNKPHWIDFDAGTLVSGEPFAVLFERYLSLVMKIAAGQKTQSEEKGLHDFAIFKTGVTL